jgi:2-phosphosulfolactate phosphatase
VVSEVFVYYEQAEFEVRCESGAAAIEHLGPSGDVVVIVDVLSFSTCVDVAVSNGAVVYPYRWRDDSTQKFAKHIGAIVAAPRRSKAGYSLSPASLLSIAEGTKLVLPSPNGSALSLSTGNKPTIAGCLRNANAVAQVAGQLGKIIVVVPAGERWPDGSIRPAVEDLVGAGAIIASLQGSKSPEALLAEYAFAAFETQLLATLRDCSSGKQLVERGYDEDVELAAKLNDSQSVPILTDGAYHRCSG